MILSYSLGLGWGAECLRKGLSRGVSEGVGISSRAIAVKALTPSRTVSRFRVA